MKGLAVLLLIALPALASAPVIAVDPEPTIPEQIVSPSSVGEVVFPHRKHVEEIGVGCAACHHETNAAVLRMPHPQYLEDYWLDCKICHREGGSPLAPASCSSCHPSFPTSVVDQTVSAKVAIHRGCWGCHEIGSGAEATARCALCHNRERIAAPAPVGGKNSQRGPHEPS